MAAATGSTEPSAVPATPRFRGDIEGLRAVAVGLVLWYHAGLPWVSGGFAGVDVFFVISGFLITSQLVREVDRSGTVSLSRFYARRAKRLFPAAFTVLAATAALVWLVFPKTTWRDFGGDIAASAAYLINWRLAERSVDYLAEDVGASPVQHFWSLAVEEQYYIVWPLLILALALLIRRFRLPVRPVLAVALTALILLPSLAWSIYLTDANPPRAYFVTTTRLWELAVGALVAIAATVATRLPRAAAITLGWAGLALIGVGALAQSTATPWPGTAAAVPTLGAAAVVVAGFAAGPAGPTRVLGVRPMVWVGGLSYSLYLWHWPLVVAAKELWPDNDLAPVGAVLLAFLPSWAANRWIENPIRHAPRFSTRARPALVLGLVLSLAGVGAGLALAWSTPTVRPADPEVARGGAVLGVSAPDPAKVDQTPAGMTPQPVDATADVPDAYARNCQVGAEETEVRSCSFGVVDGEQTIALVGDSKILQWLPAFEEMAAAKGWHVVTWTRSACPFTAVVATPGDAVAERCHAWGDELIERLSGQDRPDLVVTSAVRSSGMRADGEPGTSAELADGYVTYWNRLHDAGVPVLALSDTPQPGREIYECVAENAETFMTDCRGKGGEGLGTPALRSAAKEAAGARFFDITPWICPGGTCWPVIGEVLVYRQGSHVTATYARTLAPVLQPQVEAALGS